MDFDNILLQIKASMGEAPRKFGIIDRLTWYKKDFPEWKWQVDDMKHAINLWDKTFKHGKLSWGRIVQVNKLMFEDIKNNCPGEMLIWMDNDTKFNPILLTTTAQKLFNLKGNSDNLTDADEKAYAQSLENERLRAYGKKIPTSIANGLNLRASLIFFQRRHLPERKILGGLFPVLYLEEDPMVVVVVPHKFWPKDFTEAWKNNYF